MATCTAAVLSNDRAAGHFVARVVTVRHCIHPSVSYGISIPPPGTSRFLDERLVLPASVEYIAKGPDRAVLRSSATGVEWGNEDWAILRVESPAPLATLPVLSGDPTKSLSPGERVALATYYDDSSDKLEPHQLAYNWQGTPTALVQGGNSGAPILRNGHLVALFSGATMQSANRCARPARLTLVNIQAVLESANAQGFDGR
jgi:hypothetical protein